MENQAARPSTPFIKCRIVHLNESEAKNTAKGDLMLRGLVAVPSATKDEPDTVSSFTAFGKTAQALLGLAPGTYLAAALAARLNQDGSPLVSAKGIAELKMYAFKNISKKTVAAA